MSDFKNFVSDFRQTINESALFLQGIPEQDARKRIRPDKWSAIEIVGHLVDSASNNHQRFVRGPQQGHLIFMPYDQNVWVSSQRYEAASWPDLVNLWRFFNLHLASVMELTPEEVRTFETTEHNFDQIAWRTVPKGQPSSLGYFMRDYAGHLNHHLQQIRQLHP